MRPIVYATAGLLLLVLAGGCKTNDPDMKPSGPLNASHRVVNEALMQTYHLEAVDNAVVRQHTIYPYHFIAHSAELNELGRREAFVLGHHYRRYPGPLNVRRGSEPEALYRARVQSVVDVLVQAGLSPNQINVQDGMPGGDGLPSNQVLIVLERMQDSQLSAVSGRPSSTYQSQQQSGTAASNNQMDSE